MAQLNSSNQPVLSFPKERIRVLLLENIHPQAVKILEDEGYQVTAQSSAMTEDELIEVLPHVTILGIRSSTKLTQKALSAGKHLLAVGAFCIGTNQIDLDAASDQGTAVFNAPFQNTRSVVELALGEIIMLMRRTMDKSKDMHAGVWRKSAAGSYEVRGKQLGIVGYGHIGSQLSVLAEALGMNVVFYDTADKLAFGNAKRADSLESLLKTSDVVSVHVDGRPGNKNLIGQPEFAAMKPGAIFLNLSRGFVVDDQALVAALKSGKLAGAGLDVFPQEPAKGEPFDSALKGLDNVILTPHVASGTQEAQVDIARYVSGKLISFINTGNSTLSVNTPELELPAQSNKHRLLHMHRNEPGVMAAINRILGEAGANIAGQYLATNPRTGYVITDIDKAYSATVKQSLAKLPETIRVRLLY